MKRSHMYALLVCGSTTQPHYLITVFIWLMYAMCCNARLQNQPWSRLKLQSEFESNPSVHLTCRCRCRCHVAGSFTVSVSPSPTRLMQGDTCVVFYFSWRRLEGFGYWLGTSFTGGIYHIYGSTIQQYHSEFILEGNTV